MDGVHLDYESTNLSMSGISKSTRPRPVGGIDPMYSLEANSATQNQVISFSGRAGNRIEIKCDEITCTWVNVNVHSDLAYSTV